MTTATEKEPRVQKLVEWPNKLGFDCTVNNVRFEIWNDGRFVRVVSDESLCGFSSTHYVDLRDAQIISGNTRRAQLAYRMWRDCREMWNECE